MLNAQCKIRGDSIGNLVRRLYYIGAPVLLAEAALCIITAIFLVLRPTMVSMLMTGVVGVGLILFGVYRVLSGVVTAHNGGGGRGDIVFGLINIIFGVWFCIWSGAVVRVAIYMFVVLGCIRALRMFVLAINLIRARVGHGVFMLVMGAVFLVATVGVMVLSQVGTIRPLWALAIMLVLYGASGIYALCGLWRLCKVTAK